MNDEIVMDSKASQGSSKTGSLRNTSLEELVSFFGNPNVADDIFKVRYSWGFRYKGVNMAIWDWKGSADDDVWSIYGPLDYWAELFPCKEVGR